MPSIRIKTLQEHRRLLINLVVNEWRRQYAGTAAGRVWIVLRPMILMSLYTVTYLLIFRVRPVKMTPWEYVLYIFSGLIPFLGFSEALNAGTAALKQSKTMLLNAIFPAELITVRSVIAAQASMAAGLTIMIFFAIIIGTASPLLLLIPILWALMAVFLIGICWVLGLINIVVGDIQQIIGLVVISLMIISPIAYTEDMVPRALKIIIYFNPFAYFAMAFHHAYLGDAFPLRDLSVCVLLSLSSFWGGYTIFQRARRHFFDYL